MALFQNTGQTISNSLKSIGNSLKNAAADLLSNNDFISRTIGMNMSYDGLTFLVQSLGREPISLLGKNYQFIFDHVRRNYRVGTDETNMDFNGFCNKFTFYKEKPTVRFADPYNDSMNLLDRWVADMEFQYTSTEATNGQGTLAVYAESDDDMVNNKSIAPHYANSGIRFGGVSSFPKNDSVVCDLVSKTNANFNYGKYRTLISRFHTNSQDSKDGTDITQTAISKVYGMSHGRNLLKLAPTIENGYDNPYCRVWTNHHQYHTLMDAIRPFDVEGYENLEKKENNETVGFRTTGSTELGFQGGSARLDKYGVLNKNGMVNIAPTTKLIDYFGGGSQGDIADDKVDIKKCMFSIENLAWKSDNITPNEYDQWGLSPEQKGPLGGRIMWFPPYDLSFSEDVRVNWNSNQFIGRGENVYTYTNTERSGNLSFTLLIDHPSILDYWNGLDRNGMKNQGKYLKPGNTGGVDERLNQENTLLRFFAGCEILSAKPQEFYVKDKVEDKVEDVVDPPVETDPPEPEVHNPTITNKVLHCVLYYPNNYSGIDDAPIKQGSTVNAVYYLMNGVGAQKQVNLSKDAVDIPTTIDSKPSISGGKGGGYEIGNGNGISIVSNPLSTDYEVIKSTYSDLSSNDRKAQYLTDESGKEIRASYMTGNPLDDDSSLGFNTYQLAKIVGNEALSLSAAKTSTNLTKSPYEWYRRRWYYRVDKAYENQRLTKKESYIDTNDLGLNGSSGFEKVKSNVEIAKAFGLNTEDENTKLISFTDLFVALEGTKAKNVLSGLYTADNVKLVEDIIKDSERYNITSIKFEGHASYQGYSSSNDTLSTNRALTFKKWMMANKFPNVDEAEYGTKKQSEKNNVDKGENNELSTKLWRSASVIIEYEEAEILDASTAESTKVVDDGSGKTLVQTEKVEIPNGESSLKTMAPIPAVPITPPMTWDEAKVKNDMEKVGLQSQIDYYKNMGFDSYQLRMEYDEKYGNGKKAIDDKNKELGDGVTIGTVDRYDNEGEFFETLSTTDPFLHNLITDKIKYFDPAFHSISPEGFNARLTFLHQCTRQGSTVGASDEGPNTAYNLAFGRPPVCVLRLGDFYYTKIIINSLSIQYDNPQWDLNPEGIGVMPMFAKVTLGFTFLGGSDLGGPISRLQNAVSFNYYANASVYDNRAEMVQYDAEKTGKEVKFKPFSYPNMMHNGLPKKLKGSGSGESPVVSEVDGDYKNSGMVGRSDMGTTFNSKLEAK